MTRQEIKTTETIVFCDVKNLRILPYSIAFDFIALLKNPKLDNIIRETLRTTLPQRDNYENEIDLWIDLESAGEITVLQSKALATVIANAIQEIGNVRLVLNSKTHVTRDNKYFLRYLMQFSNKVKVIYRNHTYSTSNDYKYLKWPCFTALDNLNFSSNIENILPHAWRCAELGAEEVAFRILYAGMDKAEITYLKQLYLVQLQFMRIATQYYEDAAMEPKEISQHFNTLYESFHLAKAWGSILTRRIKEAKYHFETAKVRMNEIPSDLNALYRMNIYALFQHLSGNTGNAFIVENRIKKSIQKSLLPHPQITYINSINLARLYRHVGNYDAAKNHYDIAFNTKRWKTSETDLIYSNVCYGMLCEKQNQSESALHYWLQAAIYWLEAKTPESLGWRAVRAILQPEFMPRTPVDIINIEKAILTKLKQLLTKSKRLSMNIRDSDLPNDLTVLTRLLSNGILQIDKIS